MLQDYTNDAVYGTMTRGRLQESQSLYEDGPATGANARGEEYGDELDMKVKT